MNKQEWFRFDTKWHSLFILEFQDSEFWGLASILNYTSSAAYRTNYLDLGIHKMTMTDAKLGMTKEAMANKVLPFLIPLSIENGLTVSQVKVGIALK